MKTTIFTLTTTMLLSTLFLGCASKEKPTLACFKGSSSCISQAHPEIVACPSCHAIII